MLKTVPFYSIIRSFELREQFSEVLSGYAKGIIPRKRQDLNLENAKWFLKTGYKNFHPHGGLTFLVSCCKEYIAICDGKYDPERTTLSRP